MCTGLGTCLWRLCSTPWVSDGQIQETCSWRSLWCHSASCVSCHQPNTQQQVTHLYLSWFLLHSLYVSRLSTRHKLGFYNLGDWLISAKVEYLLILAHFSGFRAKRNKIADSKNTKETKRLTLTVLNPAILAQLELLIQFNHSTKHQFSDHLWKMLNCTIVNMG